MDKISVRDFMTKELVVFSPDTDIYAAIDELVKSEISGAPIVDKAHHFLGVITADDVLEIVEEEASEDVYKMSGISPAEHTYFETSVLKLVWQRSSWLIGLLLLQSVSSFIIAGFQDVVDKFFIISMFLTMLIGTGGNAGNQSSALVIRGLATGEMSRKNGLRVLLREFRVAILISRVTFSKKDSALILPTKSIVKTIVASAKALREPRKRAANIKWMLAGLFSCPLRCDGPTTSFGPTNILERNNHASFSLKAESVSIMNFSITLLSLQSSTVIV